MGTKEKMWARKEVPGGGSSGWVGSRRCWERPRKNTPQALLRVMQDAFPNPRTGHKWAATRGGQERTNTKNRCVRKVGLVTSEGRRVQSGFKTVEGATKAIKVTMTTPSQESMTGIRVVIEKRVDEPL